MISHQIGGVTVDICRNCGGIWFDKDELRDTLSILKKSSEDPFNEFQTTQLRDFTRPFREILCPRCNTALQSFNYAYDSGIVLDHCPNCGGIWANKNAIEDILTFLKQRNPKLEKLGKSYLENSRERQIWIDLKDASSTMRENGFFWQFRPLIVLPLGDDNPREHFPGVTIALILINIIIFICEMVFVSDPQSFFNRYGSIPLNIAHGKNLFTVLTSMFIHGSPLHVLGNMFFLWIFGDNIEDVFRPLKFVILYLICGISGDILHTITHLGSNIPAIGASGAISGLMGVYFAMFPMARIKIFFVHRIIYLPALFYLGMWIFLQSVYGWVEITLRDMGLVDVSNIGFFAHIGGFIIGMSVALVAKRFRKN